MDYCARSSRATSTLIHNFVFGWAIEWVFFLGEIVALLIYHNYFDRLEHGTGTTVAFFYALFAWLMMAGLFTFVVRSFLTEDEHRTQIS